MILSWQEYYNLNKGSRSVNEISRDYYMYIQQQEAWEETLHPYSYTKGGGITETPTLQYEGFLLQENYSFLLQETGDKLYL